ncbi:hypothetical protein FJZ39_00185 [Candidatus Saccharibacteria bacterium]|nr:hypothetical protein [Candidatus Saccharibacteria bacterium]
MSEKELGAVSLHPCTSPHLMGYEQLREEQVSRELVSDAMNVEKGNETIVSPEQQIRELGVRIASLRDGKLHREAQAREVGVAAVASADAYEPLPIRL